MEVEPPQLPTTDGLAPPTGVPHSFYMHVMHQFGEQFLAIGQKPDSGYKWVAPDRIEVHTKITGMRPAIEQAVLQVERALASGRSRMKHGQTKENMVAHVLRGLNDWPNLTPGAMRAFEQLGFDGNNVSRKEREQHFNHTVHSPIPFGEPKEILSPDITIDMGEPHTLDLNFTKVQDLGNDIFRIFMISNNKNNSHTGHILGSFVVQMPAGTSEDEAIQIGNSMVEYTLVKGESSNRYFLYLDDAAKAIMNHEVPFLIDPVASAN